MSTLERAIAMAAAAHAGQVDKGGQPYILHPLRVMLRVAGDQQRIVGVLHDVLEDTGITVADLLAAGFEPAVIEALQALTRGVGEPYDAFVRRAAANPLARTVKLADIDDNVDLSRIPHPGPEDMARLQRYRQARQVLEAAAARC